MCHSTYRWGNYSREETIQGQRLFVEIRYTIFKSVLLHNLLIFKAAQLKALLYLSGKILVASYKSANSYLFLIHCRLEPNLRSILSNFHHFLTPAHGNISNEYFNIFIPFFRYKTVAYLAWVLRVLQHLQYWDNLLLSPPFGTRNFGTIYYCQHPQFKSPKYGCVQNCREIEIVSFRYCREMKASFRNYREIFPSEIKFSKSQRN